ncbi:MAG: two-component regulator propeller domain-containing protein [Aridibacter sp.]
MIIKKRTKIIFAVSAFAIAIFVGINISQIYQSVQNALFSARKNVQSDSKIEFKKTLLKAYQGNDVKIWQSFAGARDLVEFQNSYFAATDGGLVKYSKNGEILKHFSVLDGLPESDLVSLSTFQNKLYIGTRTSGLLEFDGENFVRFQWTKQNAQTVSALLNDNEQRLLIGTFAGGLIEFDGTNFREIKANEKQLKAINFLKQTGEKLFVGTFDNGLWIYEKGVWKHFTKTDGLLSNRIIGVAEKSGKLYAATDLGFSILEAEKFRTIEILPALSGFISYKDQLYITRNNGEIFTFRDSLIEISDKKNLTETRFAESSENLFLLSKNEISQIENQIVKKFADYPKDILTDNFISTMEFDKQNNLWAGTFRDGIDVLDTDGKLLKHIKTEKIREINFLKPNGNGMDAATTNGLLTFKSDFSFTEKNDVPINVITHISEDILATTKGLIFNGNNKPQILSATNRLPNNSVYTTLKIGKTIYAGTLAGLAQIENKKVVRTWKDSNSNLKTNWITALHQANDRIFIGTYGGGIFELLLSGEIRDFQGEAGKFVVNFNALAGDDKRLYAGTLEGLKVLDLETQKWTSVKNILPSQTVMGIAIKNEKIYIGTSNGIAVIEKSYFGKSEK